MEQSRQIGYVRARAAKGGGRTRQIAVSEPGDEAALDERYQRALDEIARQHQHARARARRKHRSRFAGDLVLVLGAAAIGELVDSQIAIDWVPFGVDVERLGPMTFAVALALCWREWGWRLTLRLRSGVAVRRTRRQSAPQARRASHDLS